MALAQYCLIATIQLPHVRRTSSFILIFFCHTTLCRLRFEIARTRACVLARFRRLRMMNPISALGSVSVCGDCAYVSTGADLQEVESNKEEVSRWRRQMVRRWQQSVEEAEDCP